MRYFKKLESERLYLAPLCMDDAETYCKWINDPSTSDGLDKTVDVMTLEDEKEWLEKVIKSGSYNFSIVKKDSDTLIGNCTLFKVDNINQSAEVGIMIGEETERNKGYGKEAIKMLLKYGFEELNLHTINIGAFSFNERAIKCYKSIGFKEVGRMRECRYHLGTWHDLVLMDMLRDEFLKDE